MHVQKRSCNHGSGKNEEKNSSKSCRKKNVSKCFLHRDESYDFSKCKVRVLQLFKTLKKPLSFWLSGLKNIEI